MWVGESLKGWMAKASQSFWTPTFFFFLLTGSLLPLGPKELVFMNSFAFPLHFNVKWNSHTIRETETHVPHDVPHGAKFKNK